MTTLLWFRHDLRLSDHPALRAALKLGAVVPVYLDAPHDEHPWELGGASRWWLHHSLAALDEELRAAGSRLIIRQVNSARKQTTHSLLKSLLDETDSQGIVWNRRVEPQAIKHDAELEGLLKKEGYAVQITAGDTLFEPGSIRNQQDNPFQVFTPFWKTCLKQADAIAAPLPRPREIPAPKHWPKSLKLSELELLPTINWDAGFSKQWTPGEADARERLHAFINKQIADYKTARDVPAEQGTSMLSPHLHFGEITPRQIWHELQGSLRSQQHKQGTKDSEPATNRKHAADAIPVHAKAKKEAHVSDAGHYLREIGWREFAQHLLYHFPQTPEQPLREKYRDFPWRMKPGATGSASASSKAARDLRAWQRGQTGYPIVDAGMRQLWHIGWMHNRVRMIVGSFLVKHLLLPWQDGAAWFWDTLVDADLGNNTLGWQWVAGCGADAAPYFRVFNPTLQGEKFDAAGKYVRQWVPELAALPDEYIHAPWTAPHDVLREAKIQLGRDYPQPIVDHKEARAGALAALKTLKG